MITAEFEAMSDQIIANFDWPKVWNAIRIARGYLVGVDEQTAIKAEQRSNLRSVYEAAKRFKTSYVYCDGRFRAECLVYKDQCSLRLAYEITSYESSVSNYSMPTVVIAPEPVNDPDSRKIQLDL